MAPPTRLRPHLNDLLQKNLELEHVVADLRHQLTESFAKWADERKTLATGCDALMASFAKFRARLDIHPTDLADSEGEIEQNLDGGTQCEETGGADTPNAMPGTEGDQTSSVAGNLRERCDALAAELRVREEELEKSRKRHEAAEEELQRAQQSLEAQSEQLQAALASATECASSKISLERTSNDTMTQPDPSGTELKDALGKLSLANQEIGRLKELLQQWKKYGNDWKRDAQTARNRMVELQLREEELNKQVKAAEESESLVETGRLEIQRLTSELTDQTAALEQQRTACQESLKRIHDLEAMVSLLRTQLTPEQLASIGSGQKQPAPEVPVPARSSTPRADTDPNKRSDMIVLKIPYRSNISVKRPTGENDELQEVQQNQSPTPAGPSTPVPRTNTTTPNFNPTDFELCIHTCNSRPCRNESQSFLWSRKQASLPRHALSAKKHRRCAAACPGHRLLMMPVAEAMKEPRRAKCRPPSEAELTQAAAESARMPLNGRVFGRRPVVAETRHEESGESDELEELEEESAQEEGATQKGGEEGSIRKADPSKSPRLGKRPRSSRTDAERKLRPRVFFPR